MIRLIAFCCVALLTGCAANVKYAPRVPGFQPGYVETRLGENTYQVRIGEAWPKDWPDLEKFAMYRAADVTQAKGMRYFKVISASTRISNYEIRSPAFSTTTGTVTMAGSTALISTTTTTISGSTSTLTGGWYTLDFRLIPDAELKGVEMVVDSQQVIKDLRYFIDSRR